MNHDWKSNPAAPKSSQRICPMNESNKIMETEIISSCNKVGSFMHSTRMDVKLDQSEFIGGWIPPNRSDLGQYAMKTGMSSKFKSAQIKDLIFSLNMPQIYKFPTSLCRICIYILLYSIHTCFHLFPGFESSAHPVAFCHCPLGFPGTKILPGRQSFEPAILGSSF